LELLVKPVKRSEHKANPAKPGYLARTTRTITKRSPDGLKANRNLRTGQIRLPIPRKFHLSSFLCCIRGANLVHFGCLRSLSSIHGVYWSRCIGSSAVALGAWRANLCL